MPQEPSKAKNYVCSRRSRVRDICGSRKRHFWHTLEVCGGDNAIQSQEIVDWDLRKELRQSNSYQMTQGPRT